MNIIEIAVLALFGYLGYNYFQKKKATKPLVKAGTGIGKGTFVTTRM